MGKIARYLNRELNNSLIYIIEAGFSGILSIGFYVFIAYTLTLEEVGAYSLAVVYGSILAAIANLGLSAGYERSYFEFNKTSAERGSLIFTIQIFASIFIISALILGVVFSNIISIMIFNSDRYIFLWIFVLISLNISEFCKFYFAYLKNSRQARLFSFLHASQVFLNFFLAYVFLIVMNKDFLWLGVALLISHLAILIFSLFHQIMTLPFSIKYSYFNEVIKISLPLTPRVLIGFIGTQFDKIILSQVSSLSDIGVYSVAHRIAMIIYMFMNALGRVWSPILYENLFDKKSEKDPDISFLSIFMYFSLIPAIILILFSQEILLFLPESYAWGYQIIIFLSLYYSLLFFGKVNGPQLMYAKKTWLISGLSVLNVLLSIAITYPMVIAFDAVGASIGMLLSGIVMGLIYFYQANKHAYIVWDFSVIGILLLFLITACLLNVSVNLISTSFTIQALIKMFFLIVIFNYGYKMNFFKIKL